MNQNLISNDYLIHYGVKGMKWGVRHDPRVINAKNNYNKAASNVSRQNRSNVKYRLTHPGSLGNGYQGAQNAKNEKKLDNLVDKQRKAAEEYHNVKRFVKNERYKNKLTDKAESRAANYRNNARETKNEIDDINRMGNKSEYWKSHAREQAENYTRVSIDRNKRSGLNDSQAEFWGKMAGGAKYWEMTSNWSSQEHINKYVSELSKDRSNSIRLAKQYTANKNSLMNYKIDSNTRKRDIRKVYRKGLSFGE